MVTKRYIVVAYDIADDERRNRVSGILAMYGWRVNKSVFECFLKDSDIEELKKNIASQIKKNEDIVLYYYLCRDCMRKIERVGKHPSGPQTVELI
jgi:CRISPR-associated protein Cas2